MWKGGGTTEGAKGPMENFSQNLSGKSDALRQRMDELKAQLAKCQEEYERVRREEFKEAVRRFLEEFHIETIEDLNNAAMKLRGMHPEIVKEAAKDIRAKEGVKAASADVKPSDASISAIKRYAAEIPQMAQAAKEHLPHVNREEARERLFDAIRKDAPEMPVREKTSAPAPQEDAFDQAPEAPVAEPVKEETPAFEERQPDHVETFLDETEDAPAEEAEEPTPVSDAEPAVEEAPAEEKKEAPASKEDDFDFSDDSFDMNWDFGDDEDAPANEVKPAEEAPAQEETSVQPLSEEKIASLVDDIEQVDLDDEQIAAFRKKQPVVRAAGRLLKALFTAEQELDPTMALKDVTTLYDYNPAAMQSGSSRDKYKEADRLISVLSGNITEADTPKAYADYEEFKNFPDFIQSRAMALAAMEIDAYFAS